MRKYDTQRIQKLNANKLKKILDAPERRNLENDFAHAHTNDSDEMLYAYVADLKKRSGDKLKAADVIGYRYLTERLGTWPAIMTQVNKILQNETENK